MLHGDFFAGVEDDANQLIPTAWVEQAQQRYRQATSNPAFTRGTMAALGVDAARGGNMGGTTGSVGKDKMVISPRYDAPNLRFFDSLIALKGVDVNTGNLAAAQVIQHRRHGCPVQLDVAAIGTSVYDALNDQGIHTVALNGAAQSQGRDHSTLLKFTNRRAEFHWRMREALDPEAVPPAAIPDDPELLADLTAPRYTVRSSGITVEPKADIKKRIGRSPDKGEALMYANVDTPRRDPATGSYLGSSIPQHLRGQLALAQGQANSYDADRLEELNR